MTASIIIDEISPEKIKVVLQQSLREYNYNFFGPYELKRFALYMQNNLAEIIAGIYGFILDKHSTVRLEFAWVREDSRKQGIGTKLFKRIDEYALSNNCRYIQASTMEFQGPSFFEKMGYKPLGSIPKWFCDQDEIFFLKEVM